MARGDTLREQLMGLNGVADAAVDTADGGTGVRVRLAPGADARVVGAAVQRVLASHGLRSRVAVGEVVAPAEDRPQPRVEQPTGEPAAAAAEPVLHTVTVEEGPGSATVTVSTVDGERVTETAEATEDGVARAVVAAVARLLGAPSARLAWVTRLDDASSGPVITVVVEMADGSRRAGAAIVRAGAHYAVARAAFDALR